MLSPSFLYQYTKVLTDSCKESTILSCFLVWYAHSGSIYLSSHGSIAFSLLSRFRSDYGYGFSGITFQAPGGLWLYWLPWRPL